MARYVDTAKLIVTWIDGERKSMDRVIQRTFFKVADMMHDVEADFAEVYAHLNDIVNRIKKIEDRLYELEPKPINVTVVKEADDHGQN
jgi:hypothetical protein